MVFSARSRLVVIGCFCGALWLTACDQVSDFLEMRRLMRASIKLEQDAFYQTKVPIPVHSLVAHHAQYDSDGTTSSLWIIHWAGPAEGISADEWLPQHRFREDHYGDRGRTVWYSPDRFVVHDHESDRFFKTLYPNDADYRREEMYWWTSPASWKKWLDFMAVLESSPVEIDGRRFQRYFGRTPGTGSHTDYTLDIDAATALPHSVRKVFYEKDQPPRSEAHFYNWNTPINPALMAPDYPDGHAIVVVDLSRPAPRREVLPGTGVGELKLGMSRASTLAILGEPDDSYDFFGSDNDDYLNEGLRLQFDEGRLTRIECQERGAYSWVGQFRGFPSRTPEGIGIGSSRAEVIAAYGELANENSFGWSRHKIEKNRIEVVIIDDLVTEFILY